MVVIIMQVKSAPWLPQPFGFGFGLPAPEVGSSSGNLNLVATVASLRLGHQFIQFRLQPLLGSFFRLGRFGNSHGHFYRLENNLLSSRKYWACFCLFDGWEDTETRKGLGKQSKRVSNSKASSGNGTVSGRQWTNLLLAINVLLYVAQIATQGKLLFWGAKINSLVDKGQLWRLATSSFLHANIGHLMVNCYSLNSIGPTMEKISGPRRYLALYFVSAVASSTVSYWFSKAPSIGASGAIFGLVGSMAVFVIRHRGLFGGGREELQDIARVIALNMVIGLLSKGIDNWGHLGGFLGGVATSWFIGPAWKYESLSKDGKRIFTDRAPISYLINRKNIL